MFYRKTLFFTVGRQKHALHNADKFDRKGRKTVVQILDLKEALWLQLTYVSIHLMRIVMSMWQKSSESKNMALAGRNVQNLNGNFGILPDMGQNATTPHGRNSGTVHCDTNSDAPNYKKALKLQICQKKSTFGGFLLKIFSKIERTGQKAPRVSIITAAGMQQCDNFRLRIEMAGPPPLPPPLQHRSVAPHSVLHQCTPVAKDTS